MALTDIADQKTPGRPVEVTLGAELGLPSANEEILLFGHMKESGAGSGTAAVNTVVLISNVADPVAGKTEADTKFGAGTELAKMVLAAIKANYLIGGATFPPIKCVPLAAADTAFGSSDAALTAAGRVKAEFIVSPYTGTDATLRGKIKDLAAAMSGAQRVENNQYGTVGVVANFAVTDPTALPAPDTQYLMAVWLRDTGTNPYSLGELAAAAAAIKAACNVPFKNSDNVTIGGVTAPAASADWITVGAGLESEAALAKGWCPLRVKSNGEVAIVRAVTTRITTDGTVAATAYYDVEDFMVLYYWRKTLYTRLNQPDLKNVKASIQTAQLIKGEVLRLAAAFEDQGMFQAVAQLGKQFIVQRSASDRHRFDIFTPVNVVPGLHVVASNVQAGTQFDVLSI
jgi:phage tail sheath gpL-like